MLYMVNPIPYSIKDTDVRGSKSNKFSKIINVFLYYVCTVILVRKCKK